MPRRPLDRPLYCSRWKDRAREVMKNNGISERELARRAGFGPTSANYALRPGTDVHVTTVVIFAKVLGVSPSWLLFGDERS